MLMNVIESNLISYEYDLLCRISTRFQIPLEDLKKESAWFVEQAKEVIVEQAKEVIVEQAKEVIVEQAKEVIVEQAKEVIVEEEKEVELEVETYSYVESNDAPVVVAQVETPVLVAPVLVAPKKKNVKTTVKTTANAEKEAEKMRKLEEKAQKEAEKRRKQEEKAQKDGEKKNKNNKKKKGAVEEVEEMRDLFASMVLTRTPSSQLEDSVSLECDEDKETVIMSDSEDEESTCYLKKKSEHESVKVVMRDINGTRYLISQEGEVFEDSTKNKVGMWCEETMAIV